MRIVGADHTENVKRIKQRATGDYDKLLHEDFRELENLDKRRFLRNLILTPVYALSFFFLIPLRFLRRKIGRNRKSDYIFREESSIPDKISIDAHPAKLVEIHEPIKEEIAFNWAPIFLAVVGTHIFFELNLTVAKVEQNIMPFSLIIGSFLVIFLSQIVLSWFLSLEERDQYMTEKILEESSKEDSELVLVGDAHASGIYSKLSSELDREVNIRRLGDENR
jgi:hypothetical protein